ncbi:hypothetical protein [Streptomonospora nanhaiensis]|nr:hypothetical protein [Streptomonospora nanhaiensis]MBV2364257.1 hypothetical protein [Streptomonospora nanhaiensis]
MPDPVVITPDGWEMPGPPTDMLAEAGVVLADGTVVGESQVDDAPGS